MFMTVELRVFRLTYAYYRRRFFLYNCLTFSQEWFINQVLFDIPNPNAEIRG